MMGMTDIAGSLMEVSIYMVYQEEDVDGNRLDDLGGLSHEDLYCKDTFNCTSLLSLVKVYQVQVFL